MSKTVGSSTTYYLYDGDALIAEVDSSTNQVTRSYTWGADGLVSDHAGTQSRFYLLDALGNARSLLDPNGNLLATAAYTAYGTPVGAPLPSTPFGWQGEAGCCTDAETGLVFMQARYYAPSLGRFVSRDPIGFAGGINHYAYCYDDPINYIDPGGTEASPLMTGLEALRYAFTFTLWKPDEECESSPGWEVSKYSAAIGAIATYTAAAMYVGPAVVSLAPAAPKVLNPIMDSPLPAMAAEEAENPAADEQSVNISDSFCQTVYKLTHDFQGRLALGLSRNLRQFAIEHGAAFFEHFAEDPDMQTQEGILNLMNHANEIYFNFKGFDLNEYGTYLMKGDYSGLSTNWEYMTIMKNPSLFNKTSFIP